MSFESSETPRLSVGRLLSFREVELSRNREVFEKEIAALEGSLLTTVTEQLVSDEAGAHELLMRSPLWRALRHGLEENDSLYTEMPAVLTSTESHIIEEAESVIADFVQSFKQKYPSNN